MTMQHFRLLTEEHVKSLLPMSDLIAAMESALARFSAGEVLQPVRTVLTVGPTKAYFGLMPAYIAAAGDDSARSWSPCSTRTTRAACRRTWPRSCCSIRTPARSSR